MFPNNEILRESYRRTENMKLFTRYLPGYHLSTKMEGIFCVLLLWKHVLVTFFCFYKVWIAVRCSSHSAYLPIGDLDLSSITHWLWVFRHMAKYVSTFWNKSWKTPHCSYPLLTEKRSNLSFQNAQTALFMSEEKNQNSLHNRQKIMDNNLLRSRQKDTCFKTKTTPWIYLQILSSTQRPQIEIEDPRILSCICHCKDWTQRWRLI